MTELWLKFKTDDGETERVQVNGNEFYIGRHSECDLSLPNGTLSRRHVKITSFGEVFVIDDCDSTYGTQVNGEELDEPVGLKDGDVLDLGGVVKIEVEFVSDRKEEEEEEESAADSSGTAAAATAGSGSTEVSSAGGGSSIPTSFFILAPVFGLVVLLGIGGGVFLFYNSKKEDPRAGKNGNDISTPENGGRRRRVSKPGETPKPESSEEAPPTPVVPPTGNETPDPEDIPPTPPPSGDMDKTRAYSASFLSRIVAKDPDAFLLDRQIQQVVPIVNQMKSSAALPANMAEVKKNSARISSIAGEKGLKPEFLAAAVLAKLGNSRGDVVATAQKMADVLQKLQAVIGVESADDATVVVAAYYQGEGGSYTKMQSTIEVLSKTIEGVTARQIRTIWFLNEKGKLTPEEFNLALRFIAIGTIMQKPDEFNVKAEALTF